MAVSSCSLGMVSSAGLPSNKLKVVSQLSSSSWKSDSTTPVGSKELMIKPGSVEVVSGWCCPRRSILTGVATLATVLLPASAVLAEEVPPPNYRIFVDKEDGYSYYYPSDWRDFDFTGHDSAFKDRYLQLQNLRLYFVPTEKTDVHDLGPMEKAIPDIIKDIYAAPNQVVTIFSMQERTTEGKNYYTVEYVLTSPNFARTAFVTMAIANGRWYTLNVGANERRWKRYRNQLKVVADSFKVFDI